MSFITLSLKRLGKASSSPEEPRLRKEAKEDPFADVSLFVREPVDFDLITQMTHMSGVATAGLSRDKLFEGTAELDYSTSKYFRRVHRVAQRLNYDYSTACEAVAEQVKRDSIQNLLLHFSTALSSGESEADFLERETGVQLELYGKKYERDMESLKKWTDAYIALMVSTTLIVVITLVSMMIYPFGLSAIFGLSFIVMISTVAGAWVIFAVSPHEVKTHHLARRSAEQTQMEALGVILVTAAGGAMALVWMLMGMALALIVGSVIIAPLGFLAWRDDQKIDKRDRDLSVFLRGLGGVMGASSTTVAEGLSRMNRKALGAMEGHVHRLYVRLSNDINPEMSWLRLCGESGSELVTRAVRIFWDGIRVGGEPGVVGKLASEFAQKVSLLRQTRSMVANTFMFVAVPMHAALLAILLFVTEVMRIFGHQLANVQDENLHSDIVQQAGVSGFITFANPNFGLITVFVAVAIVLLTVANSFAPYAASGGHKFKFFAFAAVMMLMSGVAMLVIPPIVQGLFAKVSAGPPGVQ
jgi:archaeal flagellar protein FlaJ